MQQRKTIVFFSVILLLFCSPSLFAQRPTLTASVNRTRILIGDQFDYTLTASFPTAGYKIHGFSFPDSAAHFEVVNRSPIDTNITNDITVLQQVITITSFDSGLWKTPAIPVNFDPVKDDTTVYLFSDSIPVLVSYQADSSQELKDIKPVREVKAGNEWLYYIAAAVLGGTDLAIIVFIIIGLVKGYHRPQKNKTDGDILSAENAYSDAMMELDKIRNHNLEDPEMTRQYHTALSGIFRLYLSRKLHINLMNKTTGEVLVEIPGKHISHEQVSRLAAALRCGDAVKFAKYLPPGIESRDCFDKIKETIDITEQSSAIKQT